MWNDTQLKRAVKQASSYRDVCIKLNTNIIGGKYRQVRNRIISLNLDISHFNPFSRPGKVVVNKIPTKEILVENSTYGSARLRKRLIKEGLLKNKCCKCGLGPNWNKQTLTLQLDHKNGISNDNRIKNLRILCPNCHSQTKTYAGKNSRKDKPIGGGRSFENY